MQTIRGQCGCRHRKWTDCRNSVDFSSVFFFYVRKPDRDKCIWCLSGRNIPYSRNNNNNKSNNRRKKLKLYCLVFCILSNTTGILDNKRITKNYLIEILVVQLRLSVAFILRLRVCVSLYFFLLHSSTNDGVSSSRDGTDTGNLPRSTAATVVVVVASKARTLAGKQQPHRRPTTNNRHEQRAMRDGRKPTEK